MLTGSHTLWPEEGAAREIARIGVDQEWFLAPVVCAVVSETNVWFHYRKENVFIQGNGGNGTLLRSSADHTAVKTSSPPIHPELSPSSKSSSS
jgi:hypothetical protein